MPGHDPASNPLLFCSVVCFLCRLLSPIVCSVVFLLFSLWDVGSGTVIRRWPGGFGCGLGLGSDPMSGIGCGKRPGVWNWLWELAVGIGCGKRPGVGRSIYVDRCPSPSPHPPSLHLGSQTLRMEPLIKIHKSTSQSNSHEGNTNKCDVE